WWRSSIGFAIGFAPSGAQRHSTTASREAVRSPWRCPATPSRIEWGVNRGRRGKSTTRGRKERRTGCHTVRTLPFEHVVGQGPNSPLEETGGLGAAPRGAGGTGRAAAAGGCGAAGCGASGGTAPGFAPPSGL